MSQPEFHVEHSFMEEIPFCPLCGGTTFLPFGVAQDQTVTKEEFRLVDCAQCGLRATGPRPSPNAIGKYYNSEDYISHTNSEQGLQNKLYQLVRKHALARKYALVHKEQPNGQLLDIGCGTGEFLAYLTSRGYLVQGVEPDIQAREKAIANHSLSVVPSLTNIPAREQFQVVTMWHVLEHLHELRSTMKRLYALLAVDGNLIIAVPDRESRDAAHYSTHWAAYDVPRHLWHFRTKDIARLLHEHGFELVRTLPMWFDAYYVSLLSEKHLGTPVWLAWPKAIILGIWSNLNALTGSHPTSSTLYVARKTPV